MTSDQTQSKVLISSSSAEHFTTQLLIANNVPSSNATVIARALIAADLRGIDTHGILRLPSYLTRIRAGALSATASPTLHQHTPCVASIDGHNAFGHLSAHMGIHSACDMASTYGIGMVSIKHSNHFGMSAWICSEAIERGYLSLVFTNSSPALPAFGGKEKILGVSPLACGAPGPDSSKHFILDMAPSIAARGKVHKALRRGESIPEGWALDKEGRATTDPAAALDGGVMLPMGGPKGSALAIMMDVFSGVLSGSAFAGKVQGPYEKDEPLREADVGHFIVAIKPDLFVSAEEFRERMGVLYASVTESEKAAGVERIYFPGELELICEVERKKTGIPFTVEEVESLNAEAEKVGSKRLAIEEKS